MTQQLTKKKKDELRQRLPKSLLEDLNKEVGPVRIAFKHIFRDKIPILEETFYGDVLLARSVLDRALVDMFSPHKNIRNDVFEWLDIDNESFLWTCERAQLSAVEVFYFFKFILEAISGPQIQHVSPYFNQNSFKFI